MGDPQPRRLTALVGIGLVNVATITWATNMILGRWLRDDIGPLTLAASRFFIASLFFAILLRRPPRKNATWDLTAGCWWGWP